MGGWGPAPLHLQLSPALAMAMPDTMRAQARSVNARAEQLGKSTGLLRRVGGSLVPLDWLSLAAQGFDERATELSGRGDVVAKAMRDLGTTISGLASKIETAKADAQHAVARGDQVDRDTIALNQRADQEMAADPNVAMADPGIQAESERLIAAASRAQSDLSTAEAAAKTAWDQARAAFDITAYSMPQKRVAMDQTGGGGTDWDPMQNLSPNFGGLVEGGPMCLVNAGYMTGGSIKGPDGRIYPLAVPFVKDGDHTYTGDVTTGDKMVSDLDGGDPGWNVIGYRSGYTEYGYKASGFDKTAVILGSLAGGNYSTYGSVNPDKLKNIRFGADGNAALSDDAPDQTVQKPEGTMSKSKYAGFVRDPKTGELTWSNDLENEQIQWTRAGARSGAVPPYGGAPVGPNVVGLVDQGLQGAVLAQHMDDHRAHAYRVVFEENADGRVRARLDVYQVVTPGDSDTPQVTAHGVTVDPNGKLNEHDMLFRAPKAPPGGAVMYPAPNQAPGG